MSSDALVLDANILIRAILGEKVRHYLIKYYQRVNFLIPDVCILDAKKYLPALMKKHNISPMITLELLDRICELLQVVGNSVYDGYEEEAKKRIQARDMDDWPIVATALAFNSPIWTEDKDFFGVGLPTWTTNRIHLFFERVQT